jgi:hypothetical protein
LIGLRRPYFSQITLQPQTPASETRAHGDPAHRLECDSARNKRNK